VASLEIIGQMLQLVLQLLIFYLFNQTLSIILAVSDIGNALSVILRKLPLLALPNIIDIIVSSLGASTIQHHHTFPLYNIHQVVYHQLFQAVLQKMQAYLGKSFTALIP
jgi:hypothetical protein